MSTFFMKIGKADVPAKNANPRNGADWERGQFIAPKAKQAPQNGDQAYIWVNQNDNGRGLTATGIIKEVKQIDKNITFTLKDVHLYEKPYVIFEGGPKNPPRYFVCGDLREVAYGFLGRVHAFRPKRTWELSEDDVKEFESVLKQLGATSVGDRESSIASRPLKFAHASPPIAHPAHQSAPQSATVDLPLGFDPSASVDERKMQESLRAVREGVKPFRDAMMRNWDGKCAITQTFVEPALEAAHIYPYGGMKTNDERNGVLLRADVHRLFDRHWISFVYQDAVLFARVSTRLAGSEYTNCDGKRIELPKRSGACPDPKVVDYHYDLFLKAEEKR